jgi:hypothetical protein
MLAVVPAALLLGACGAPEAVPVAPAAAVSPASATQPLGLVPVDMGPAPAREVVSRVAAQGQHTRAARNSARN